MPLDPDAETNTNFQKLGEEYVEKELKKPRHDYDRRKLEEQIDSYKTDILDIIIESNNFSAWMHSHRPELAERRNGIEREKDLKK